MKLLKLRRAAFKLGSHLVVRPYSLTYEVTSVFHYGCKHAARLEGNTILCWALPQELQVHPIVRMVHQEGASSRGTSAIVVGESSRLTSAGIGQLHN